MFAQDKKIIIKFGLGFQNELKIENKVKKYLIVKNCLNSSKTNLLK